LNWLLNYGLGVSYDDIFYCFVCSDDTVEVGADLYIIDTEATASATITTPAAATAPAATAAPAAAPATPPPPAKTSTSRTPSIHFRGKDGRAQLKASSQPKAPTVIHIPPMYGRPAFTEQEIEALITGGANTAPVVKQHSSGAVFGYM
jgi:pyruvate/2-oxoglutarate dehydrogenase complex dihydrolipoamide acyltransferase (E2) component